MTLAQRLLALVLLWLGVSCAGFAQAPADPQPERELLVMLHLPKPHYRPDGSYAGAYGDGPGQMARRRVAAALAGEHGLQMLSE